MEHVVYQVKKFIVGQDELLERLIVALLARGHILVEGVPGLAKTMAIKTLAQTIGGQFQRIQFTPDLVPADLVGTRIYNQKLGEFQTSLGPVHTNLLLADEINRAPAKVQSALLEVMQERQVTIGRETRRARALPRPGDAEPHRDRGHLPAARGAARSFHAQGPRRLPDTDRGVRHRRAHDGRPGADPAGHRHHAARGAPADGRRRLRRPGADRVRGAGGGRLAGSRLRRPRRPGPLRHVRRQPPGLHQHDPGRQGPGLRAGPPLRTAHGRPRPGARRPPPPDRAVVRGTGRRRHRRPGARAVSGQIALPEVPLHERRPRPDPLDRPVLDA